MRNSVLREETSEDGQIVAQQQSPKNTAKSIIEMSSVEFDSKSEAEEDTVLHCSEKEEDSETLREIDPTSLESKEEQTSETSKVRKEATPVSRKKVGIRTNNSSQSSFSSTDVEEVIKEIERGIRKRAVEEALKKQQSLELIKERDKIEKESTPSTVKPIIDLQITDNESISSDPRMTECLSSDSTDSSLYLSLPAADTSKAPTTPLGRSKEGPQVTSTPLHIGLKTHTQLNLTEIPKRSEMSGEAEKPNAALPAMLSLLPRFYLEKNDETTSPSSIENFYDDYTEDVPPIPVVKKNIFSSRQCLIYKADNWIHFISSDLKDTDSVSRLLQDVEAIDTKAMKREKPQVGQILKTPRKKNYVYSLVIREKHTDPLNVCILRNTLRILKADLQAEHRKSFPIALKGDITDFLGPGVLSESLWQVFENSGITAILCYGKTEVPAETEKRQLLFNYMTA